MHKPNSAEREPPITSTTLASPRNKTVSTFRRFSLSTFLLIIATFTACLTTFILTRPVATTQHEIMLWELDRAVNSEFAIVFVQLDWTFLIQERQFFGKFANLYNYGGSKPKAAFHAINFTSVTDGYGPLAALPGWKDHDPGPNCHQINGVGEIIWLKNGTIVGIGRLDHIASPEEAVRMTQQYFGIQARNTTLKTAA